MKFRLVALMIGLFATVLVAPVAVADEHRSEDPQEDVVSAAQEAKLRLLADYVAGEDADDTAVAEATEQVTQLREADLGWGAMYKLLGLAAALGEDPMDLLGDPDENGEYEIGFGELRQQLTEEQLAVLMESPRNLGQLKKMAREDAAGAEGHAKAPKPDRGQGADRSKNSRRP